MRATKLKIIAALLPLSMCASQAAAKSILVTGSIEAVPPEVSFPSAEEKLAFVTPFNLVAKEGSNSGCRLTGDPSVAMADHGDELVCLYEWTNLPDGMFAAGMAADGYLKTIGENEFSYSISYFSGSNLDKVKISEGTYSVNAVAPTLPEFINIKTNLSNGTYESLDVTNYNRSAGLRDVTVTVESKPYRQIVKMSEFGSCVVELNETDCTIDTNGRSIGSADELTGKGEFEITIDAENGYFKQANKVIPENYILRWDYRSPSASALFMQARSQSSAESIAQEVDGVSFVVENEQARLVVDTPHFGLAGSWWVPSAKLELVPDPDFQAELPIFKVNGYDVVESTELTSQPQQNFVMNPQGTPEVINGKYIYTFDLTQVSDGKFIPKVSLTDAYDNRSSKQFDAVFLDRQPPDVQLFYSGKRFADDGVVYFFENMAIVALDTFDGGAEIVSAKVNGVELRLNGESKYLKTVQGTQLNLIPQRDYPLEILVKDSAGNSFVKSIRIRYMPMDYSLKNSDFEFFKEVQHLDLDVVQKQGIQCALYENEKGIFERDFGWGETQRCYLEWTSLPEGTSGFYIRGNHSLIGNLLKSSAESPNVVGYRVWMIDSNGNKALAAEESETLEVNEAPLPSLTVTQKGAIRENFFPVDLTGSRFATAIAKGINADLELSSDDGHEETVLLSKQRNGYFEESSVYQNLKVNAGKLWAHKTFEIEAKYSNASDINAKTTLETVYIPSKRIRSRIETEDLKSLDTANPTVSMKLGVYDSSERDFLYNKETMGEWIVYLAKERRDRETRQTFYDPITEKKSFVGGGKTKFEVDVSNVGYGSYRFLAVAELISPVEGYERTILSNSSFYRVLKGGKIDGKIKTYRIASPVPFRASISYEPEERQDREAMGNIEWQMSFNGTSDWKSIDEYENSPRLRQTIEKPGRYFIRAIVKNKFSGATVTSDYLEVLGYEIPDLKTSGPAALYEGEKGVIDLDDHDAPASTGDGLIEWSFDGENWEEGTNRLDVVGTGDRMQIWSRMSYFNNELAGEQRYDVTRHRISVKKPLPVRISMQTPRIAEVGVPFTLSPLVRLASSQLKSEIESEWVLPDGTVISGDELTYTPTEMDSEAGSTDIQFRSWVKQLKHDTLAVKDIEIRTWKYEFPDFRFDVNYRTRYAPVDATAIVRKLENLPAPVEFTYNFLMFDGMTKDRETRERLYFTATKPGLHQMHVIIKDDRGNERDMVEFLEVLPPPETEIELNANYSTKYMRQPLDASVRTRVVLGHPRDRVEKYEWYLDGKLLQDQTSSRANIENMKVGTREVKVKVTSEFGLVKESLLTIDVAPNIAPTCDLSYRQYGSTISVQSGCQDTDGRMATHNWYVDGEMKQVHANNISVTGKTGVPIVMRVTGYDDSGDTADATMTITPR